MFSLLQIDGQPRELSVAGVLDGPVRKPGSVRLRGFETKSRWSSAETGSSAHLVCCRLPSHGETQPPHFVANRSLKALISESSTARFCAPAAHLAAASRSVTDS